MGGAENAHGPIALENGGTRTRRACLMSCAAWVSTLKSEPGCRWRPRICEQHIEGLAPLGEFRNHHAHQEDPFEAYRLIATIMPRREPLPNANV